MKQGTIVLFVFLKLGWNCYAELGFGASLFVLGCMTRSLLLRKENIDHPSCSDAWKPNCIHTSQSKLKDFLFCFSVRGFIEGARGGKGFFSVLYKNKVYSCFILYCDCKRYKRVPLDSCRCLGNRGLWQVLWWLGHVLLRNKNKNPFLQHTKASSHFMTHSTHRAVYQFTDDFPLFCVTRQFQPTEKSLFVNWRFVLCLTELKFRSLCLISETKGNSTPIQKWIRPSPPSCVFLKAFPLKELCWMSPINWGENPLRNLPMLFTSWWHLQKVFEEHLKLVFFL